jgi:ubiquinone/menaquinone biosynthesis C-methylase UbiE
MLDHVRANWPAYLLGYGGGILLSLLLVVFAAQREWWGVVLFAFALLLILAYFLLASLWAAHQQFDRRDNWPSSVLFELGRLEPTDNLVHIGLGVRDTAQQLSRRLTSGRVQAVDVYNPQMAPGRALARRRQQRSSPAGDPRLTWLEGNIALLPLPDRSTETVVMNHTLSELWQHGDRQLLLAEAYRILRPGGKLLLAEPIRSRTNWLVLGPTAARLESRAHWQRLLVDSGFRLRKEQSVADFYHCFRAEKPLPGEVQQLTLDLGV